MFPPQIEVCAVQLPGRESRLAEPPLASLAEMIEPLAAGLLPAMRVPFAFFGHSMGTLISFELTRYLRSRQMQQPVHLFVAAHDAPSGPTAGLRTSQLDDVRFVDEIRRLDGTSPEVLANAELLQLVLPALRADLSLCETYAYSREKLLACPITALGGVEDRDVTWQQLVRWRLETSGAFKLRMFPGGHFFIREAGSHVVSTILSDLG